MHTENSVVVHASADHIYTLGARVEDWPHILPHYRWVTILRDEGAWRLVEMAASRDGFPVKWVSIQEVDPVRRSIRYRHVRGVTRGMQVEWIIDAIGDLTRVRIVHDFDPPWPRPLGPFIAHYVVGVLFVHNVAAKTLRRLKALAESGAPAVETAPGIVASS